MSQSMFLWKSSKYSRNHTFRVKESTRGQDAAPVDRISNLPIGLIRQILLWLPHKDVARTSVLSKKWRSFRPSLPDIYLDEMVFGANYAFSYADTAKAKSASFLTYLQRSLDLCEKRARNSYVDLQMVFLQMEAYTSPSSGLILKRWIDFALKNKVKALHLGINMLYFDRVAKACLKPYLSGISLISDTLLVLCLKDCKIESSWCFKLPHLKSLFLYSIKTDKDFVFGDFLAGFPRVEELIIDYYPEESDTIVVPNPNLKFLKVVFTALSGKLKVKSKKLETLDLVLFRVENSSLLEITSVSSVKNLTLDRAYVLEKTLMLLIKKFPLLENLVLDGCRLDAFSEFCGFFNDDALPRLFVSHRHLKNLLLKLREGDCTVLGQVIVDCPNLTSFEFCGGLTVFSGIRNLEFVKLQLRPKMLDARWYFWLRNILECFARSRRVSLVCRSEQDIIFPDELTGRLLPAIIDIKQLELQVDSSTATTQSILDGFVWLLPCLKSLSLTLGSISKLIEFERADDVKKVISATAKIKQLEH